MTAGKPLTYATKADQRANRPDLEPIPVVVIHRGEWNRIHALLWHQVTPNARVERRAPSTFAPTPGSALEDTK